MTMCNGIDDAQVGSVSFDGEDKFVREVGRASMHELIFVCIDCTRCQQSRDLRQAHFAFFASDAAARTNLIRREAETIWINKNFYFSRREEEEKVLTNTNARRWRKRKENLSRRHSRAKEERQEETDIITCSIHLIFYDKSIDENLFKQNVETKTSIAFLIFLFRREKK
jgi:hypothetical protein